MTREIFNVRFYTGVRFVAVQTLGTRIDEHFAFTAEPSGGEDVCSTKSTTVTHLPTGAALKTHVKGIAAAKRVVAAYRELHGVDWGCADVDALKEQTMTDVNAEKLKELASYRGEATVARVRAGSLEWLLAKPEWKHATVTGIVNRQGFGACHKIEHSSGAVAYLVASAA